MSCLLLILASNEKTDLRPRRELEIIKEDPIPLTTAETKLPTANVGSSADTRRVETNKGWRFRKACNAELAHSRLTTVQLSGKTSRRRAWLLVRAGWDRRESGDRRIVHCVATGDSTSTSRCSSSNSLSILARGLTLRYVTSEKHQRYAVCSLLAAAMPNARICANARS